MSNLSRVKFFKNTRYYYTFTTGFAFLTSWSPQFYFLFICSKLGQKPATEAAVADSVPSQGCRSLIIQIRLNVNDDLHCNEEGLHGTKQQSVLFIIKAAKRNVVPISVTILSF